MSFEATCTGCGHAEVLTSAEADELVDPRGYFLCDDCRAVGKTIPDFKRKRKRRSRKGKPQADRRMGCIVTAMLPDGTLVSHTQGGTTLDALRDIIMRLPAGSWIESISTHRTVLDDVRGKRRRFRSGAVDPYAVERTLLSRIDRLDLLPPQALAHSAARNDAG